jgi:hypothetical protein
VVALLLVIVAAVALVHAVRDSFDHTCVVCVTHHGRTVCREAVGASPDEARTFALERACAFLTANRDDRAACLEAPPESADCREN